MYKFLFKLLVAAVGIYLVMQVPYFSKFRDELKASLMDTLKNVSVEVDRIQEKIAGAEKVIDDTKEKIDTITENVADSAQGVTDALTTIDKTAEELKKVVTNEPAAPEGTTSPKIPAPATP